MVCGMQAISCFRHAKDRTKIPRETWSGRWPGEAECEQFGWYSKRAPNGGVGWVTCEAGDEGAGLDLNRLSREAVWDPTNRRWIRIH